LKYVLIRCDGASEIGFGHVVRCLALADELRNTYGCQVDFAMLQGPQGFEQVRAQGYQVHHPSASIKDLVENEWLLRVVAETKIQALVLDVRTDLATSTVHSIRESGVLIVTIDDPSERRLYADLAFYPPVPQVERLDWKGFTGKIYIGWDWVLLRPQFSNSATRARARGALSMAGSHSVDCQMTLLVTMGGSDPAMMTLISLKAIDRIEKNLRVLVVLGSGFSHN
jgi:spore coat polysaccharide biosynthesis protein SpsF